MKGSPQQVPSFPHLHNEVGQQRPTALARVFSYARNLAASTMVLAAGMFVAEKILAPEYKPSYLMGHFAGSVEQADIEAKQAAAVAFARQQAEAQAQAQARAQIEAEVSRQQQQMMADSLAAQSFIANGADIACLAFNLLGDGQTDTRALCAYGDQVRRTMVESQARAGRDGASVQPRTDDGLAR